MKIIGWEERTTDLEITGLDGKEITLKGVPMLYNKERDNTAICLTDLIKARQKHLVLEQEVSETQHHILLLLYAKPEFFKHKYIDSKFRFNKMLFYHWQNMKKADYGDSFIFDEFDVCRAGPIPRNLSKDSGELHDKGLIEIMSIEDGRKIAEGKEIIKKPGRPGISKRCVLTKKGEKVAKYLWDNTDAEIKEIILKTKSETGLLDSTELRHKVHADFPEYKKTYVELDAEEF